MVFCDISVEKGSSRLFKFTFTEGGNALDLTDGGVDKVMFVVNKNYDGFAGEQIFSLEADSVDAQGEARFNVASFDMSSGLYRYSTYVVFTDGKKLFGRIGRFYVSEVLV